MTPAQIQYRNDTQHRISQLLLEGCENQEIARKLGMQRRTVKSHFTLMFRRYKISAGGNQRVKLASLLYQNRWQYGLED